MPRTSIAAKASRPELSSGSCHTGSVVLTVLCCSSPASAAPQSGTTSPSPSCSDVVASVPSAENTPCFAGSMMRAGAASTLWYTLYTSSTLFGSALPRYRNSTSVTAEAICKQMRAASPSPTAVDLVRAAPCSTLAHGARNALSGPNPLGLGGRQSHVIVTAGTSSTHEKSPAWKCAPGG